MSRRRVLGDVVPDLSRMRTETLADGLVLRRTPFLWWPRRAVARDLPPDFHVEMECFSIEGRGSSRRLALLHVAPPPGSRGRDAVPPNAFLVPAVKAGEVIRCRRLGLGNRRRDEYRLSLFLFQVGPRLQEHLARRFDRVSDLANTGQHAKRNVRSLVLPELLGCDAHGGGRRWSLTRLLEEGKAAAQAAGEASPIPEAVAIRCGLWAAARRAPLDPRTIDRRGGAALVRSALFDHGPLGEPVSAAVRRRIRDRLVDAFLRHVEDSGPDFDDFFFDRFNEIVCQVARGKSGGGPIDRTAVRQGMLDLVFRAYRDAALCHDAFMEEFARGLSPRLDVDERTAFAAANRSRPELGGLPLDYLRQHFDFLREAVIDVYAAPADPAARGVLLRLLDFYATLSRQKRQSDRDYRRTKPHKNLAGQGALVLPYSEGQHMAGTRRPDEFQEVTAELRELRKAPCACGNFHEWRAAIDERETTKSCIVYWDGCARCGPPERCEISPAQYDRMRRKIFDLG